MGKDRWTTAMVALLVAAPLAAAARLHPVPIKEDKGVERFRESWRVLEPITRRNLSIYPVVSALKMDTSGFLTLDEGLASGAVRILERGQMGNVLLRRRGSSRWPGEQERSPEVAGASVNELVLVNDSSRPLILLAGEMVSGGKQNRIIGADFVVPPKSDPLPLTVFCVEHGRWSSAGGAFESTKAMAHPGIRREAQASKSQAGVWDSVSKAAGAMGAASPTSNYEDVVESPKAQRAFQELASPIEADFERELREELRGRHAVGVIVAINGELVWSDVFASQDLFQKYWVKLLRSYVMEAEGQGRAVKRIPTPKEAETFLLEDRGRASVKTEPEAFRRTEISAEDYQIVALEAIGKAEDTGLLVHYNKMARY